MLETLRNAWKIEDLRKKILYTLFMLLIYRIGNVIPVPGVNVEFIRDQIANVGLLGMLDMINGSNFANFTIFAMGVQPYITASIIMQLLTIAIPKLEELQKEGEEGRKKIAQYSRYATVALGFIQAIGIVLGMGPQAVLSTAWWNYLGIGLSLAAGTSFAMWLGERITENGVGNGISMLIFIGIISRLPGQVITGFQGLFADPSLWWIVPVIVVVIAVLVIGIIYIDMGQRRVPVQYAKRVVGRKQYGGQSTHIPIKVNSTGVLPLIFASSIIQFPGIIAQFWPESGFTVWYSSFFKTTGAPYMIIFALLIVFFTYFYTTISFNAVEISKNIQQNGGFIPGIRPGKPTSDFLMRSVNRITLFNALCLAVIAVVPTLLLALTGIASPFTATGILIAVSVAMETTRQIESQIVMRHYKGFLK